MGCKHLKKQILNIKPKYHIFGHVHTANTNRGIFKDVDNNITYVNASVVIDEQFKYPILKPIIINYNND